PNRQRSFRPRLSWQMHPQTSSSWSSIERNASQPLTGPSLVSLMENLTLRRYKALLLMSRTVQRSRLAITPLRTVVATSDRRSDRQESAILSWRDFFDAAITAPSQQRRSDRWLKW